MNVEKALFCLLVSKLILWSPIALADKIDLHVMGGQSNMQGWRSDARYYPQHGSQLDSSIQFFYEAVEYDSSKRRWVSLGPQGGHFSSGHFGPEVTFARQVKRSGFNPAIFKFSYGSSSLEEIWKAPGRGGLYDRMIRELLIAIKQLRQQGHTVTIRSLTWIQGETDAKNDHLASRYKQNLNRLITHFRRHIARNQKLPVILGLDEQHPMVKQRPLVIEAQNELARSDPSIVRTSMLGLQKSDATHLTAKGVIQHGQRLFNAYIGIAYHLRF